MKNKGFTLIELLGVVILLVAISLLTIPAVNNSLRKNKEKLYQTQLEIIKTGIKNWSIDNSTSLPSNHNEVITLTLGQLKQGSYVKHDIKNPVTKECFPNDMLLTITNYDGTYLYMVLEDSGTSGSACDDYSKNAPIIVLNGDALIYVDLNSYYDDLGVSAKTSSGNVIDDIDVVIKNNGTVVNEIDTTNPSLYEITYSVTDNGLTSSINRTIIVKDMTPPDLYVPDNITLSIDEVVSFNVMDDVYAEDNSYETINVTSSGNLSTIPGKYTIVYTAIDSAGNVSTKKRVINVVKTIFEIIAKDSLYSISLGSSNDILQTYFNINNIGYTLKDSSCINTSNSNTVVTNTSKLSVGEHNITCTINSVEGKISSASTTIKVIEKLKPASEMLTENVVTSGDGLYKDDDGIYRYKGENPNNYIMLGTEEYRILAIENQGIKVIRSSNLSETGSFDGIGSRRKSTHTYCVDGSEWGCNAWVNASEILQNGASSTTLTNGSISGTVTANSGAYDVLYNDYYVKYLNVVDKYIVKDATWNIGPAQYSNPMLLDTIKGEEDNWTWQGKIGLMTYSEYVQAQLPNGDSYTSCSADIYSNSKCGVNNWLNISLKTWIITPQFDASGHIWALVDGGHVNSLTANMNYGYRPVVYLDSDIKLSGNGTQGDGVFTIIEVDSSE